MSASTLDTVLTTYLSLHAVLALLIDAQSVLPDLAPSVLAAYQRAGLTQPVARWVADEGDFLVGSNPLWFRWIVGGEVLFQLPVCIALAFGFAKRRQWVRLPSLLYGTHVLTYVEATPAMADQSRPSGGWAEASQGSGQPQAWPGAESSLRRASWPKAEPAWFSTQVLTTMVPIMGVLCSDPRPSLTCKLVYAIWVLLSLKPSPNPDPNPNPNPNPNQVLLPTLLMARCVRPLVFAAPRRTLWKI